MKQIFRWLACAFVAFAIIAARASAQDRVYLWGGEPSIQTPGHPIVLSYTAYNTNDAVRVRVYRLPLQRAIAFAAGEAPVTQGLTLVETGGSGRKTRDWQRVVVLPALPVGDYVVQADAGDAERTEVLSIGTLGFLNLDATRQGGGSFVAIDLRTFQAYRGARFFAFKGATRREIGLANGVVQLPSDNSGATIVGMAADGSSAIVGQTVAPPVPPELGYIQTDRPVYRPGDTIGFRAILRDGTIGSYALPTGTRKVLVQAPDGSDVISRDIALDTFGTLAVSVRLPSDAQPGSYLASVGPLRATILVADYKKPEYSLSVVGLPASVVAGAVARGLVNAEYFFGRAAGGMRVHYVARAEPHWYAQWFGPYGATVQRWATWQRTGKVLVEASEVTDSHGNARLAIPTPQETYGTDISVEIDAHDASGRTVETSRSLYVAPATGQVWAEPASWFGEVGTAMSLQLHAENLDASAHAGLAIHVQIVGSRWDSKSATSVETTRVGFDAVSDSRGEATLAWVPAAGGSYTILTTARDQLGRLSTGQTYLWVFGGDLSWFAPTERPTVVPQQTTVRPDGSVLVAIAIPKPDRDVVLLTGADRIASARVVRVHGLVQSFAVTPPADARQFNVYALLPSENGVSEAVATIRVEPASKALIVTLTPRKSRYRPGERAIFDARVTNASGRPQRAQLGVGVVDEAIYAVQHDDSNPADAFYRAYWNPWSDASWYRPNLGGALKTIASAAAGITVDDYSVNAGSENGVPQGQQPSVATIRSNFEDTAYWAPAVVTGANGRATIAFTWPDDLTTWRATGVAVTQDSAIGKGTGSALVTKRFLVRLEMPRFLRAGDRSSIVGIAHGTADRPHVRLHLDAGALTADSADPALLLNGDRMASASWTVGAPGVGSASLTLSGSDGVRSDAMRLSLPLEAGTAAEHVRDAGDAASRPTLALHVPAGYLAGDVHLTIAPTSIAELVQNLRLLDVYPYYCTEQTVSTALPSLFIERAAKREDITLPGDLRIDEVVRHAVARLEQLQHADGSWGWWEHDPDHPFMTAYAVYGLAEFRRDGFPVPQGMFDRGVAGLVGQLQSDDTDTLAYWGGSQKGSEWSTRAFMLYALAAAAPERVDRAMLARAVRHAGEMNAYGLAVLGLAESEMHDAVDARGVVARLNARAVSSDGSTFWRSQAWDHGWEDDPIEATAYALRLESAVHPYSSQVDGASNYLRAQRQGDWWYTTKDTAAAVYALSDALRARSQNGHIDETVTVSIDGRVVRTVHIDRPVLDAADAHIVIPAALVHDGSTIAFERSGSGQLLWTSDAVRYVPVGADRVSDLPKALFARLFAKPAPLSVSRTYSVGHDGPWRVGDLVRVRVTVRSPSDVQYVAIEDPFPAGAEHDTEQGHADADAWSGLQMFDDRAVFFADRLWPNQPLTIRYTLRVTTPGRYTAPAPSAYAMYGPPVSALGRSTMVEVVP